ncbi:hypothetical protein CTAYLR_001371 [Chrysophaeum taylorii]|uniref:protein O-GlcNAc transferase n=1 Tax=Chrysophaeum taylorii TaxID=2483200 RepID=A0AAD7U5L1_9STRA|nr:hypothetical protein CTAYLR_001371 [Chrysophaeum taylorii]
MLLLAAILIGCASCEEIVGIVSTEAGVERGATVRELAAYEAYNEGVALSARDVVMAIAKFEEAIRIKPDLPEARINAGNLLAGLGRTDEAEAMYAAALECADHPVIRAQASSNLGLSLHKRSKVGLGMLEEAEAHLKRAIELAPDFVDARFNYATLLQDLGRVDEAERTYEKVLELAPEHENARLNLANVYFGRGETSRAATLQATLANDEAVSAKTRLNALNNLGQTLRDANEHRRAEVAFRRAAELAPDDATTLANLATARRTLCDWSTRERDHLASLAAPGGVMPYDALMIGEASAEQIRDLTKAHVEKKFGRPNVVPRRRRTTPRPSRLVVGYLSFDLREHPMGYLTRRLVSQPGAVALSYGEDDGSELRRRAERNMVDIANASLGEASERMRAVDVVVDLMAHTRGARLELGAVADAPLVLSYLGYPGTAGGRHYDFSIVDAVVAPPERASRHFAEPLVVLPHSYQANDYADDFSMPSSQDPQEAQRLCNYNNVDKFEPVSWGLWMNVLRRNPRATLTLLRPKSAGIMETLAAEAAARGVSPRRIVWSPRVPKREHLERLATECDAFLDNLVYGAHTTASDALWAGVPVLTLRGYGDGRFASRVGASLLGAAGLEALDSLKDFETEAARQKEDYWAPLKRATLAASMRGPLFDARRTARDLDRAYHAAYELAHFGLWRGHVVLAPQTNPSRARRDCTLRSILRALGARDPPCEDDDDGDHHDLATALSAARRLAAAFPRDPDARHALGLALHASGSDAAASRELEAACRLAPDVAHLWSNLGHVRRAAGSYFEAAAAFLAAGARDDLRETLRAATKNRNATTTQTSSVVVVEAAFVASTLFPTEPDLKLQLGAALDDVGDARGALEEWLSAVRERHEKRRGGRVSEVAIVCDEYGQSWWPGWGPGSLDSGGLGGSEESVVFLARELARLGYQKIDVFLENPPPEDVGDDEQVPGSLVWWPLDAYESADVLVAWRYHITAALPARRKFVWLQDVPSYASWTPDFIRGLDAVFTLSAFHTRTLPFAARAKSVVSPNGIDPNYLRDGPNDPAVFAYGSAPNRGLYDLLRVWPNIRAAVPNATLVVYYGFSASFLKWGKAHIPAFGVWRAQVEALLRQDGVHYVGMVDHDTLARGYARAGFLLYPTTYPETGCVTVMKAMAMGAIPVTSRYADSVVPELTVHFDLGPTAPRTAPPEASITPADFSDPAWMADFADAAIAAARAGLKGHLDAHRVAMKSYARSRFLWRHVASTWAATFSSSSSSSS